MDGSFFQLRRREASELYAVLWMCVCVWDRECLFDVVFTQLKAVSCVVSQQSCSPLQITHMHTWGTVRRVIVCTFCVHVFMETCRCQINMWRIFINFVGRAVHHCRYIHVCTDLCNHTQTYKASRHKYTTILPKYLDIFRVTQFQMYPQPCNTHDDIHLLLLFSPSGILSVLNLTDFGIKLVWIIQVTFSFQWMLSNENEKCLLIFHVKRVVWREK